MAPTKKKPGGAMQRGLPLRELPTLPQLVDWWRERAMPQVAARNARTARQTRYVLEGAAKALPEHPTAGDIYDWLAGRVERRELSGTTANRIRVQLHRLYELARKLHAPLLLNPLAQVPTLAVAPTVARGLADPYVTFPALLTAMPDARARAFVAVQRWHGLRVSEALGLEPRHLNRDAGTLLVEQQRQDVSATPGGLKHEAVAARFPLHPEVAALLVQAARDDMRTGRRQRGEAARRYLFPYYQATTAALMERVREVAPADFPTRIIGERGGDAWHVFRHTYGTELAHSGLPLHQLQVLMRHRHLSSTQLYVDSLRGRDMPAMELRGVWEHAARRQTEAAERAAAVASSGSIFVGRHTSSDGAEVAPRTLNAVGKGRENHG